MKPSLLAHLKIEVNPLIFVKDPETTDLGKKILFSSLHMIDEMGMECFTFGKLAKLLNTAESSIYRYFESKHKLLLYFYNWYWAFLEYKIVFSTNNIEPASKKLRIAISILSNPMEDDEQFHLPLNILNNIVISESSKAYLNKEVDEENKLGFFLSFKKVANRIVDIIEEIQPNYPYAHTLVATCMEGILHQQYFSKHLPSLTDIGDNKEKLSEIFFEIIFNNLNKNQ